MQRSEGMNGTAMHMREARQSFYDTGYEAVMERLIDSNGQRFAEALELSSEQFPQSEVSIGEGKHMQVNALIMPYQGTTEEQRGDEVIRVAHQGQAVLEPGGRVTLLENDPDHPSLWEDRRRPSTVEYPLVHQALEQSPLVQAGLAEQARLAAEARNSVSSNGASPDTLSTDIVTPGGMPRTKRIVNLYPAQKTA